MRKMSVVISISLRLAIAFLFDAVHGLTEIFVFPPPSCVQKMMIVKFRERWEKLKDSAKRKKEAKAAAETAANGVRDRIVEEPEAEEELDNTR